MRGDGGREERELLQELPVSASFCQFLPDNYIMVLMH